MTNTADRRSSRRHVAVFLPTLHGGGAEREVGDLANPLPRAQLGNKEHSAQATRLAATAYDPSRPLAAERGLGRDCPQSRIAGGMRARIGR